MDSFVAKLAPGQPPPIMTSVSAASTSREFGLAPALVVAGVPWPTELVGTSIRIVDSAGAEHSAQIIVVSP